jgi:phosphotransferase system IIB component
MLLLGNVGQQIDIEDVENDVERLRARIADQQSTDQNQNDALVTLRREITDLQLVVGELTRR